jgi:hypothetical protein
LIERRETAKVLLHQKSLTSIAADAIAQAGSLLGELGSCLHVRAAAHARARAPADPRHTKLTQKIILKNPKDNKFIPMVGYR